jgi:UDP-glucose 4-epimerase
VKVLVTGGAGFIGSHTVERLLQQRVEVRVLDDFSVGRRANLPVHEALEVVVGDVRDTRTLEAALHGITHVLHLAAQVSVQESIERPVNSAAHNILAFVGLLECARRAKVSRVVYASSAAVYGIPDRLPLDENAIPDPLSPYGLEKWVDDRYAALYRRLHDLSTLGMRYFNVYGPRQDPASQYAGVISKFLARARQGEPLEVFGDGSQTRDFVYVGDVAEVNVRALVASATGVLNVATGSSVTVLELVGALSQVLGRALPVHHLPARGGDIVHSAARNDALRRAIGYVPNTLLRAGLAALVRAEFEAAKPAA